MDFKSILFLLGIVLNYEFAPASSHHHFHHHRRRILQNLPTSHVPGVDPLAPLSIITKFPRPSPVIDVNRIVRFKLYTRQNRYAPEEISVDKPTGNAAKRFKAQKKTKILIHGFVDSATESTAGEWMNHMREAYLNAEDVNVIVVDYSIVALFLFYWTNLPHLASGRLADLVYFLNKNGAPYDSFHVVGRSWGAHVAGMTGHTLCGKLGRITGLDPANPPFRFIGFEYRLDKTDAQFVDVYHLNGKNRFSIFNVVGISTRYDGLSPPVGHVDIYPNFRERQFTGCPIHNATFYTETCRLGLGARLFTETIAKSDAFPICKCDSFLNYIRGQCQCEGNRNIVNMGEHISPTTMGVFQMTGTIQLLPPPAAQRPTETIPIIGVTTSSTSPAPEPAPTTINSIDELNPEDAPAITTISTPMVSSTTTTTSPSSTTLLETSTVPIISPSSTPLDDATPTSSTSGPLEVSTSPSPTTSVDPSASSSSSSASEVPVITVAPEETTTPTTTTTATTTTTSSSSSAAESSTSESPVEDIVAPTGISLSKDGQAISSNVIQ